MALENGSQGLRTLKKRTSLITGRRDVDRSIGWETCRVEFLREKEAGGIRNSTLRTYKYDLGAWEKFCAKRSILSVALVKTSDVEDYLLEQKQKGKAISSRRNRGIVLQQMLKFAHRKRYLKSERLYRYKIVKAEVADVYVPTLSEVRVIFDAIDLHWSEIHNRKARYRSAKSRTFFKRRDKAVVAVQASVGLRPGETFSLRLTDYDSIARHIFVSHSKNRKQRYVPVTDHLAKFLEEWLSSRPKDSPTDFLFVTDRGTQLHLDSWGHQFQRYLDFARALGQVLPRITLYSLRHVAGSEIAGGSDAYKAAVLLGNDAKTADAHYIQRKMETIRQIHADNDPLDGIFHKTPRTSETTKKTLPPRLV